MAARLQKTGVSALCASREHKTPLLLNLQIYSNFKCQCLRIFFVPLRFHEPLHSDVLSMLAGVWVILSGDHLKYMLDIMSISRFLFLFFF